ncbi:MAG: SDR family NAD(P)-dependent oxidoreductase [Chloroflexota bacterium]
MIQFDLSGRVAVVTGGAKGIGLGIAQNLAKAGATVVIWDQTPQKQTENHPWTLAIETDIADAESVAAATAETLRHVERVDILVNNAGVNGPTMPTWDYPLDAWQRVIDVDLTGVFLCSRALVPTMREHGYGRVVNIASVAGKEGNANACAYSAAKAGVIALTKSLGKELAGSGITVNCLTPAMIETDLLQEMTPDYIQMMKSKIPMGRFGTIQENADMVAWLCSEECSFTTGGVFDVSGGRATY